MKAPDSSTSAKRRSSSEISGPYWALTSRRGILGTPTSECRPSPPQHPERDSRHEQRADRDLDVAEIVVQPPPVGAERPARGGEREAERDDPEERLNDEPDRRYPPEAGRDRDEGARERRREADRNGGGPEAREPAIRPLDSGRRHVQPA